MFSVTDSVRARKIVDPDELADVAARFAKHKADKGVWWFTERMFRPHTYALVLGDDTIIGWGKCRWPSFPILCSLVRNTESQHKGLIATLMFHKMPVWFDLTKNPVTVTRAAIEAGRYVVRFPVPGLGQWFVFTCRRA